MSTHSTKEPLKAPSASLRFEVKSKNPQVSSNNEEYSGELEYIGPVILVPAKASFIVVIFLLSEK